MHQKQESVVAFIDVVGWEKAFGTVGHEGLLKIAMEISSYKLTFSASRKNEISEFLLNSKSPPLENYFDINFSFFSDSFIISAPVNSAKAMFGVAKMACMQLLVSHGFLVRGGVSVGYFTHDTSNDIYLGVPLNQAAHIEKCTKMPRIQLHENTLYLKDTQSLNELVYYDGSCFVINIANRSEAWLAEAMSQIKKSLSLNLTEVQMEKWIYLNDHLPKMHQEAKAAFQSCK